MSFIKNSKEKRFHEKKVFFLKKMFFLQLQFENDENILYKKTKLKDNENVEIKILQKENQLILYIYIKNNN